MDFYAELPGEIEKQDLYIVQCALTEAEALQHDLTIHAPLQVLQRNLREYSVNLTRNRKSLYHH